MKGDGKMNVKKSIRIIEKFLRHKVNYNFEKSRSTFTMHIEFGPKVGTVSIAFVVQEEMVNLVATFPFRGTDPTSLKLAELICRINSHLSIGHFDYDFDDGEIRYCDDVATDQLKAEKDVVLARYFAGLAAAGEKFAPCIALVALGIGEPGTLYKSVMAGCAGWSLESEEPEKDDIGRHSLGKKPVANVLVQSEHVQDMSLTKDDQPKVHEEMNEAEVKPPVPVKNYSLEGLHVEGDFPIAKVESAAQKFLAVLKDGADALPDRPGFNILLWGPPGTGKSEFVNYLGQKLGRKVVIKMGSDILSRYVGDTEKSIREAFDEAEEENAILFLDELDGVMQDRSGATVGWEVSQVNEILNQMEHFKGIMIGATNARDRLDPAVLRRFTCKLEFDFLDEAGKYIFFDRAFKTPLTETEKNRLANIPNLTPGDFRTVSQSLFYLDDVADNATRLAALEKESAMKGVGHKVCLGFSAR